MSSRYSKRFRRLVALMVLASIFIYIVSIKPTIQLGQEVNEAGAIELSQERYAAEYEGVAKERMIIDHYFSDNTVGQALDDELFATISTTINTMGVYLSSYPPLHNFSDKGFRLMTQEVVVYGEFIPLLKFANTLEKDTRFFIHSATFMLETDRRTDIHKLLLKLYIQSIIKQ